MVTADWDGTLIYFKQEYIFYFAHSSMRYKMFYIMYNKLVNIFFLRIKNLHIFFFNLLERQTFRSTDNLATTEIFLSETRGPNANLPSNWHNKCPASICTAGHLTKSSRTKPIVTSDIGTPMHSAMSGWSDLQIAWPAIKAGASEDTLKHFGLMLSSKRETSQKVQS